MGEKINKFLIFKVLEKVYLRMKFFFYIIWNLNVLNSELLDSYKTEQITPILFVYDFTGQL